MSSSRGKDSKFAIHHFGQFRESDSAYVTIFTSASRGYMEWVWTGSSLNLSCSAASSVTKKFILVSLIPCQMPAPNLKHEKLPGMLAPSPNSKSSNPAIKLSPSLLCARLSRSSTNSLGERGTMPTATPDLRFVHASSASRTSTRCHCTH